MTALCAFVISTGVVGLCLSVWLRRSLPAPQEVSRHILECCRPSMFYMAGGVPACMLCRDPSDSSIRLQTVEGAGKGCCGEKCWQLACFACSRSLTVLSSWKAVLFLQECHSSSASILACSAGIALCYLIHCWPTHSWQLALRSSQRRLCLCRSFCTVVLGHLQPICVTWLQAPLEFPSKETSRYACHTTETLQRCVGQVTLVNSASEAEAERCIANEHAGGRAAQIGSDTAKAMASVDHAVASRRVSVAVLGGHAEGHARGKCFDRPY